MYFWLLVLISGVALELPYLHDKSPEISITSAPYNVAVFRFETKVGNGAILSPKYVATAGSCLRERGDFSIRAGSKSWKKGGELVDVVNFVTHPDFKDNGIEGYAYDYGLLELARHLMFSESVQPLYLANRVLKDNAFVHISGWYNVDMPSEQHLYHLRGSDVTMIKLEYCKEEHSSTLRKNMGCVGYPGISVNMCYAELGGPIVTNNTLFGLVTTNPECGKDLENRKSSLYSKISPVHEWYSSYVNPKKNSSKRNTMSAILILFNFVIIAITV